MGSARGADWQKQDDMTSDAIVYLYSRLPFLIQRASQILTAMFSAQSGGLNVTLPQFQLLHLLSRDGPSPQIDVARKAAIDAATAGLILGNLIRSGRVERCVDRKDARRKIVAITDKGRLALEAAIQVNHVMNRMILERLGDDARRLGHLLDRLAKIETSDSQDGSRQEDNRSAGPMAALELALKLRRCLQISERQLAAIVGPLGLTMRQFAVLYVMFVMPGLTKSDVVRFLGYEASNAALVMRILHDKGLIEVL